MQKDKQKEIGGRYKRNKGTEVMQWRENNSGKRNKVTVEKKGKNRS